MKLKLALPGVVVLLALHSSGARAAPPSTNAASTNRILRIEPSSMPIAKGTATLTIGVLERAAGIYTGDYKVNVFPYFFKTEKGRLAIVVSDESLAKLSQGKVTPITGTATTSGKGGETRRIGATATPVNNDRGTLKLWFTAGDRKMIFEPAYHFAVNGTPPILAQTTRNDMTSNLRGKVPVSHRAALDEAAKLR